MITYRIFHSSFLSLTFTISFLFLFFTFFSWIVMIVDISDSCTVYQLLFSTQFWTELKVCFTISIFDQNCHLWDAFEVKLLLLHKVMFMKPVMKQQIGINLLLHLQKSMQLILWRLMELPKLRIVMMLVNPGGKIFLSVYHLPTYPLACTSVSHRNDLTGSWCCKAGCRSACCCSCCICSALAKLRGWGHKSAPAWMKAGLNASYLFKPWYCAG